MKPFTLLLVVQIIFNIQQIYVFCSTTENYKNNNFNVINNSNSTIRNVSGRNQNSTRTIQRVMGGHIFHYTENPFDKSHLQGNSNSRMYFRRKITLPSKSNLEIQKNLHKPKQLFIDRDQYDDTLLLTDNKIDNSELIKSSAGGGKEIIQNKKNETKKTLSDQVAEGKYGLIEKELFQKEPIRPGIISYTANKEVPKDNSKNLGGLKADDIWLAEDHLLVLKGGGLNEGDQNEPWPPIDDYEAPLRPVKIPDNPAVPPPFPVQLQENGPIEFIGNNKFPFYYPFINESFFNNETKEGGPQNYYPPNIPPWFGPIENTTNDNGYNYPPPLPPWLLDNNTFVNPFVGGLLPGPGFPINETGNGTDIFDEDDPRLYYPPPYTFVYKSNYTNPVEPGPLVPGIVLPPPPNFFSRLVNIKEPPKAPIFTKLIKQQLRPVTTTTTTTTTTRPVNSNNITTLRKIVPLNNNDKYVITNYVKPTIRRPYSSLSTTTLTPISDTVTQSPVYTAVNNIVTDPPQIIPFVPKISSDNNVYNKGNPIYFEYFDARKPNQFITPITNNPNNDVTINQNYIKTTSPKNVYINQEIYTKPPQNNYNVPIKEFDYEKYYYVTPKPEIKPNGLSNNFVPDTLDKNIVFKPLQSFDEEVENIRQTIQQYKTSSSPKISSNGYSQPITRISTQPPARTAKAKVVYDYTYEPVDIATRKPTYSNVQFDTTPFKPMIQYSSPYDQNNGFKGISYSTTDNPNQYQSTSSQLKYSPRFVLKEPNVKITPIRLPQRYLPPQSYRSSTDNNNNNYYTTPRSYTNSPKFYNNYKQNNEEQSITVPIPIRTYSTTKRPWVKIEKHIVKELPQISDYNSPSLQNQQISGYNNNNYYNNENIENDQFNKQLNVLRARLRNQSKNQYQVSLINDTVVNYRYPRPTKNPNSEFIDIPEPILNYYPSDTNNNQNKYSNNNNNNNNNNNDFNYNRPIPSQQTQHNLHQDTLVNYKYPLPPIEPNSEFILPQTYEKYQNNQKNPVIQYRLPGDQAHVYFITPRELKYRKK